MSTLSFQLDTSDNVDVSVDVRRPNMSLVTRTSSSSTVNVDPGTYYVLARLPSGRDISDVVEVGEDPATASLKSESGDGIVLSDEGLESAERFGSNRDLLATHGQPDFFTPQWFHLSLHNVGDPRDSRTPASVRPRVTGGPSDDVSVIVKGRNRPCFLEIARGRRSWYVATPAAASQSAVVVLSFAPESSLSADVRLSSRQAQSLLHALEPGAARDAGALNAALDAEVLLFHKNRDPIAAAIGGYTLLKFGDLDRLHDWTKNLEERFPWLPDGSVVRAEHLAREGEHEAALESLLALPTRGVPLFSIGMSMAITRLRMYSAATFRSPRRDAASDLLASLQALCMSVDFSRAVLTVRDLPSSPFAGDGIAVML